MRQHADGLYSACPAFSPQLLSYADSKDGALAELVDFLSEYFGQLPPDDLQKFVIPEEASLRHITVSLTREDLPRADRVRTPVELPAVVLDSGSPASWVLLPTLGQVVYVPELEAEQMLEALRAEARRIVAASDVDGVAYLDLLPPAGFELARPLVEVDLEWGASASGKAAAKARARREAQKLLDQIGRPLSESPHAVLGRDVTALRSLLQGPEPHSLVLVGDPGAGKTAWLKAAASSAGRSLVATSGAELVAGQSGLGQLEGRVEAVVEAAKLCDASIYFEDFEDLFAGRSGGYEDIAGLLRRHLQQGTLCIIGELTPEGYDRLSQRHVGFFSFLQRFNVSALSRQQTLDILRERVPRRRDVPRMSAAGQEQVLALVERYEPYRVLPGKAVKLFDELCGKSAGGSAATELSADDVLHGFAIKTGIPAFLLRDERSLDIDTVERFLHQHVIGQKHAVRRVAETLCSVKAGLQPTGKPLATLLFLGPTGVGKTELSKALARFLFGSGERMARFDMSEYSDAYAADRLIRGTERADGVLTRRVREQPFGVVLLDEIEKAHSSVFDLLLQVAGEGRLSDARGKVAHFDNTIIILTSNLGAQHRRARVGFGDSSAEGDAQYYLDQVEKHFRPELVGRLDSIVSFSSLDAEEIKQVARLSVERIARRTGLEGRQSRLQVTDGALEALAEAGFSASYGARGLRRYLEQGLVAPLSGLISALGEQAEGAVFLVERAGTEPPGLRPQLSGMRAATVAPVTQSPITITAAISGREQRREKAASGIGAISRMRRSMRRWHGVRALAEARDRQQEITVQLAQAAKSRTPGHVVAELGREHGLLQDLLKPLDEALQQVEDIEALLVSALNEAAPDLEPDALALQERFKEQLLVALFRLSKEDSLCFAMHELDDKRVLHDFLLPLLEFGKARGWELTLHFDRGAREPGAWPKLEDRRWGPPIPGTEYLQKPPPTRPSDAVLVRARGAGAGALLSFYLGRIRYNKPDGFGELWLRLLQNRYDLRESDWQKPSHSPVIDRNVGRKQTLTFWSEPGHKGSAEFPDVEPHELLQQYSTLVFSRALTAAMSGRPFLGEED